MMEKNAKIYVAGHRGMVGSAIVRELERQGYIYSVKGKGSFVAAESRIRVQMVQDWAERFEEMAAQGNPNTGNATTDASRAERLSPDELVAVLRPAMEYATAHGMEINFTSPGWLPEETLRALGFTQIPSCGACLSNMAIAPDGTVLPCQSWLSGPGLGNLLHTPWHRIWRSPDCCTIRNTSAAMERRCQLGETPLQEGCQ